MLIVAWVIMKDIHLPPSRVPLDAEGLALWLVSQLPSGEDLIVGSEFHWGGSSLTCLSLLTLCEFAWVFVCFPQATINIGTRYRDWSWKSLRINPSWRESILVVGWSQHLQNGTAEGVPSNPSPYLNGYWVYYDNIELKLCIRGVRSIYTCGTLTSLLMLG